MIVRDLDARQALPRERSYKIGAGQGLHLAVQPSGSKLWRMKFRFHGRENVLSFGRYPEVTLAEARAKCIAARELLRAGRNPALYRCRPSQPALQSFEAIARMWHAGRAASLCPAHAKRVVARLERDVFPLIGGQPITGIRVAEVLDVLRRVEDRGAADITRRLKQNISQIFRFAMANDWTDTDPTIHLLGALKPPPRRRHMPRVDLAELRPLVSAVREYDREANSRRSETTRQALMLTLLTWARTGEVRFATWSEFEGLDEPDRRLFWRIPAGRMKMREEHLVPLPRQAEALVRERYLRMGKGRFVFGSGDPDKPMSENTMLYARYRMGYHRHQTVHGFRGLASTWANESGRYRPDWIEVALAHDCRDKVRAAYNSARYLDSRRSMLQDWADHIEAIGEQKRALNLAPAPKIGISTGFRHGLSILGHSWG